MNDVFLECFARPVIDGVCFQPSHALPANDLLFLVQEYPDVEKFQYFYWCSGRNVRYFDRESLRGSSKRIHLQYVSGSSLVEMFWLIILNIFDNFHHPSVSPWLSWGQLMSFLAPKVDLTDIEGLCKFCNISLVGREQYQFILNEILHTSKPFTPISDKAIYWITQIHLQQMK